MSSIKLASVRFAFLAITWIGSMVGPKAYRGACKWLHTYLRGKGGEVEIPVDYVKECMGDFLYALQEQEDWEIKKDYV